ncbi:hypothetical protein [Halocynthiibacter styelae]|uniref:Pentapeptide repeat-containing protein n=1 Tax=Halocynthiibacter styelae TaxID=2761955 RepID=A0A8J7ID90_9RHOB|nr:hypothetical protein [Paenihalocynthiibacter styelae]MBI1492387.1 hypothetical protein [Paenihalocynthiibacter styelae]
MVAHIENLLTPDCENCQALCCVALAIDKGPEFALDKPAGMPCPNLRTDHRCKIHENLTDLGFGGCVRYSCLGAGQWVSALYGRETWRANPQNARPMMDDFATAREMRAALELLIAAARLPLPDALEEERQALITTITPGPEESRAALARWPETTKPRHQAFLVSLRAVVSH